LGELHLWLTNAEIGRKSEAGSYWLEKSKPEGLQAAKLMEKERFGKLPTVHSAIRV